MDNEERRDYIQRIHNLVIKIRPFEYQTIEERDAKERLMANHLQQSFSVPQKLYKYREPRDDYFLALERDYVWFSYPSSFDDRDDATIKNDIDGELRKLNDNYKVYLTQIAAQYILFQIEKYGIRKKPPTLRSVLSLFDVDGQIRFSEAIIFLARYIKNESVLAETLAILRRNTTTPGAVGLLKQTLYFYLDDFCRNQMVGFGRDKALVLSLTERGDDDIMWEKYAGNETGFCIEYKTNFVDEDWRYILINLYPIYYGEQPRIDFLKGFVDHQFTHQEELIQCFTPTEYQTMLLSQLTKKPEYRFENEWRVFLGDLVEGKHNNLYIFPSPHAVILGSNITPENEERLLRIAKNKNLSVYKRVSSCDSPVKTIQIYPKPEDN